MPLTRTAKRCIRVGFLVALLATSAAQGELIEVQRALFKQVHAQAERGQWDTFKQLSPDEQESLRSYPLWPDLRATWFRATMNSADHREIEAFLERYGVLKPARDLRYRYALHLAAEGHLDDYLRLYQQYFQGLDIARLDCLALEAEIAGGNARNIVNRAKDLWMVGHSQVSECDPAFAHLQEEDLLSKADYLQRFELAVQEREFALARWLSRSINAEHVDVAARWRHAQNDPEKFVRRRLNDKSDAVTREQLVYAIERITYRDPDLANELWGQLDRLHAFSTEQENQTARHIALWTARDHLADAYRRLADLPHAAQDDEVLRWRARTSLRADNWQQLLVDISQMSDSERESEEWRYWYNVALRREAPSAEADAALTRLAGERSYYGFLAADEMKLRYALQDEELDVNESLIAELARRPDLVRARELFEVGQDGRGRSEWDAVIGYLTPAEKMQAAKLADRWGWHSRAISTIASVGHYDDLSLRYPLPYSQTFAEHSASASIPPKWAYGIARSESLFMRDIRSSAGAIGLMQLMPATGKEMARQIRLPYAGIVTLTNPTSNIRLGTTYLGQMANRYRGNRVLATAAYNAGPHRVDRWLPASGKQDARIWIETIPFNETRKYVRRVMAAETIFHWRMTGEIRRLSDELAQVESASFLASL